MERKTLHQSYLFILAVLFFLVSSCEKEVELKQKEERQKLAVICSFSPDEPFSIHVSKSHSLFSEQPQDDITSEALVEICEADILIEKILPSPNGSVEDRGTKFQSISATPKTQKKYTLKIKMDGVEPITAISVIPNPVEISRVETGNTTSLWLGEDNQDKEKYAIETTVTFTDPPSQADFYQINFYQELTALTPNVLGDTLKTIMASLGEWFSIDETVSFNQNVIDHGFLFKDFTFDGTTKELTFEPVFVYKFTEYNPTGIIVELRTVSKEYYYYYSSVYQQQKQLGEKGNKPFSDPVVVYSNVKNGYGVFAGYSKHEMKANNN